MDLKQVPSLICNTVFEKCRGRAHFVVEFLDIRTLISHAIHIDRNFRLRPQSQ